MADKLKSKVKQLKEVQELFAPDVESEKPETYTISLSEEVHLVGQDLRFAEQWDDEKFVVAVWGNPDLLIVDREKPEQIWKIQPPEGSSQNLCVALLPNFDPTTLPFCFVVSQTQLLLVDLRRLQAFQVSAWEFRGAPHNKHQMALFWSQEAGFKEEGINLLCLQFDGSNSTIRRLFFSPDFVQAIRFLGQD